MHQITLFPYGNFEDTIYSLHRRDLAKQVAICQRALAVLEGRETVKWQNAPFIAQWYGHTEALKKYLVYAIERLEHSERFRFRYRGHRPTFNNELAKWPEWVNSKAVIHSHRRYLKNLRPKHYSKYKSIDNLYRTLVLPVSNPYKLKVVQENLKGLGGTWTTYFSVDNTSPTATTSTWPF